MTHKETRQDADMIAAFNKLTDLMNIGGLTLCAHIENPEVTSFKMLTEAFDDVSSGVDNCINILKGMRDGS